MSATMEMPDFVELVPEQHRDVAMRSNRSKQSPIPVRKRHVERWSTSLDPRALQCLLATLEEQVIPQLIAAHSPAMASPLAPPEG